MRTHIVVLALLLLLFAVTPAAAQDAPVAAGDGMIYLPLVQTAPGDDLPPILIEDHVIGIGEELEVSGAVKPATMPEAFLPPEIGTPLEKANDAPAPGAAPDVTYVPLQEGFEGAWPTGRWRVFDANALVGGEEMWNDTSYTRSSGSWSAWAAAGGANALSPWTQNYAHNMRSWAIYGPFTLEGATSALLSFNFWNNSEVNFDFFGWYASTDGANFYGQRTHGYSGGWRYASMSLGAVPGYGSMLGDSSVWIAFVFNSDATVALKGPFIDNVQVSMNLPEPPVAYYYNGAAFNVYRGAYMESWPINYAWGSGSPKPGLVWTDNFSVKWKGSPKFARTGTYNFYARSDDGVRIYVDGVLVVNGWYAHAPLPFSGQRYLSAGYHNVEVWYYEATGDATMQAWWTLATP
jgi:hypothetical protein